MINIEALDKIIAVVVVILILSLFVQSLQALLKKLFKIKSLQIETSLVHLFHYIVDGNAMGVISSKLNNSPILRMIMPGSKHPSEWQPAATPGATPEALANTKAADEKASLVKDLYCAVEAEFRKVGRVTTSGKMMLDSISKGDLMKFVGNIQNSGLVDKFAPNLAAEVDTVREEIETIEGSIATITAQSAAVLTTAKEQLDEIDKVIAPLIADARKILSGQPVDGTTALADIAKLGEIKPEQLAVVQAQITQAIINLNGVTGAEPVVSALNKLSAALNALAIVPEGIAAIKNLLGKLETWYDTVMQSFEERYTRGMKTWAWVISALVVIFLNADLLNIYKEISTGDAKRAVILQAADQYRTAAKSTNEGSQNAASSMTPEQWYDQAKTVIDKNTAAYTSLGFEGPKWILQIPGWWKSHTWSESLWQAVKTLFGWFVMTLLLSAGAPFWEDTLESLFGIKNLLRGKSGTKNVEEQSGEGQTKS